MKLNKKKLTDIEQEKSMYAICASVLTICLFSLLFLSDPTIFSAFEASITGAAVLERNLTPVIAKEEQYINYENVSFENISQEIALNAILQAEKDIQEMQGASFGIVWVNDTLIEAKKYFEGENYTALLATIYKIDDLEKREKAGALLIEAQKKIGVSVDYKKVLEKTKAINERKTKAYEISDNIRASELRIKELKETLDMTVALELLDKAKIEFKEERYEDAIALLAQIEPKIDEIKSENTLVKTIYRAGKENVISFVKEYYAILLIFLGLILVTLILSYNRIMIAVLRNKIKDMSVEKDILMELMKKAQKDYFATGDITKQTYEIKIAKYKDRLVEVKQKLPVAETLLDKRLHSKRVL